ncbi:unnamed protein product [Mytilus coruscus]|uniref:Retrotransposon gag domain-containing protein n=1 Tax=Mytilus coruscus TaxID=42192 RepID=A0A6J8BA23_MYTCO|nr:unnamed protein product [Mytilus coruscus]
MIHVADAVRDGFKKINIKTVDTDVIVIAISVFKDTEADEIWIAFATGKHFRYIPIHDIAQSLGPLQSRIIPIFHAFTGCDTVFSFEDEERKQHGIHGMFSPSLFFHPQTCMVGRSKTTAYKNPFWTILAEAVCSLEEMVHTGCKKGCRGQCKGFKSALPCTALCKIVQASYEGTSILGGKTYGLLRNLSLPDKPGTRSYDDIVKLLKDHLRPKPLIVAGRFRFYKRYQIQGETVNRYVAELRKFAEYCEFGNLNESLRDQFVVVLTDEQTQKKL